MNLYIYCQKNDLSDEQIVLLNQNFSQVFQIHAADFTLIKNDKTEKVVALDPDVVDWKFSNDLIDQIPNLRAICLETTGYEWIDGAYCQKKNIAVTNVPKYASNAVAEKCLFMALALAKKYPLFAREGKMNWAPEFIAEDLTDKVAGIVGLGAIGSRVAELCRGLGMKVCYYSVEFRGEGSDEFLAYDELVAKCDFIFITVSKNSESAKLFSEDNLDKYNKNVNVIIVANGFGEVSEKFAQMTAAGRIRGAAFEVDDPDLSKYPGNVFVTPPNAYYTKEALTNMFRIWVDTMISAAAAEPKNVVN